MPLILPHISSGDGHVHWNDITPYPKPCQWLAIQKHKAQSKSPDAGGISKVWRSITGDPYAGFSYRVITTVSPWQVLAVEKGQEEILTLFNWLSPHLSIYSSPPADLPSIMLRLIEEYVSQQTPVYSPPSSSTSPFLITSSSPSSSSSSYASSDPSPSPFSSASSSSSSSSSASSSASSSSSSSASSSSAASSSSLQPSTLFREIHSSELHPPPPLSREKVEVGSLPVPRSVSPTRSPFSTDVRQPTPDEEWRIITHFGKKVSLQCATGLYLRADRDTSIVNGVLYCRGWEKWELQEVSPGRVALMSKHRTYLQALPSGAVTQTQTRGDWAIWAKNDLPGGFFTLTSFHGIRLRVVPALDQK